MKKSGVDGVTKKTILLAVGGASSSVQPYKDTVWQASRDAIARSGRKDVEYVEVNSAGASLQKIYDAIADALLNGKHLLPVLKSHGGAEFLRVLESFIADNRKEKIPKMAVILCDVHSLNRRKLWWGPPPSRWNLWGRARYSPPVIKPEWRSIAVKSHWTSISQFNRKPYGTKFYGADETIDFTGDGAAIFDGEKLVDVDHFNIAHHAAFHASLEYALWWTA